MTSMKETVVSAALAIKVHNPMDAIKAINKVIEAMLVVDEILIDEHQKEQSIEIRMQLNKLKVNLLSNHNMNICQSHLIRFMSIMSSYNNSVLKPLLGKEKDGN